MVVAVLFDHGALSKAKTVARVIADQLKACGVEHFFCVTGGDQPLWIALDDVGITIVPCRSEHAAAYAADGYARLTGRPAFVYGQYGPGVASVASGLTDSYWAMSPVVSLTSSTRTRSQHRFEYQELDQVPMVKPVTKWAATLPRPDRAAELVRAVIRTAIGVPPGPVHLEVPADLLGADAGEQDVLNNRCLAFEYHDQRWLYDNRIVPQVNDFLDVNYADVATAAGATGIRVSDPGDLGPALAKAMQADGPALVDVLVDKEAHAPVSVFERVIPRTV